MAVPPAFVCVSVRMPDRSEFAKSAPLPSFLIASPKLSVMFPPAFVTVAPFAGRNVGDGAVASTVKVALAAAPWMPVAKLYQSPEIAT